MNTSDHTPTLTEGRLSASPSPILVQYVEAPALEKEIRKFREFLAVDMAHTVMLVEERIITREAGRAILQQLLALSDLENFPIDPAKGSFLLQVEAYLFSKIGEDAGGQMHTGRSRIDQGATVRRLYKRNRMLRVMDSLLALQLAIVERAERHARTVMPGYTHMQHAQPWVFGHYLLSFSSRLHDSFTRMTEAYSRVNRNPLGTVGLSGTSWPLNRQRTTELLGFDGIIENSKLGREAYYAAEAIGGLAFVMADLNDLATDLHIWSSFEFGLVECDDSFCGTSSIFPQKKNPTGLEAIKKAAGGAVTWLATALATFRAEGTGDQAMRELPLIDEALDTTQGMLDLCAAIIRTLLVHEKRMAYLLSDSWCAASNLADVLVREKGLSFRQVHHIVARLVRNAIAADIGPRQATGTMLDAASIETVGLAIGFTDDHVRRALDPYRFVETRVSLGSVAPAEVDRLLAEARRQLANDRKWLQQAKDCVGAAEAKLHEAASSIAKI